MNMGKNKDKVNMGKKRRISEEVRRHSLASRMISLVLSFAMILTTIGVYDLSGILETFSTAHTVQAAGGKYNVVDYVSEDIMTMDGDEHHYYELTSLTALVQYSQIYYEHTGHANDIIKIDLGEGMITSALTGFESIGNDDQPFAGRIYIGASSYTTFNLDCPFFGTVKDSVQVYEDGTTTPKNITITRIADAIDEPLFARKVVHDKEATTFASWSVTVDQYTDGTNFDTYPFAGFIGEMGENAKVTLTAVNNAVKTGGSANINSASKNIGLLCQTMGAGASLTATYSGTNTNFAISTASGNAGGLVGQMGAGSSLTVNTSGNPQSSNNEISTTSGYAGGLVGYNDGGTVTINGTGTYAINQSISGVTATGAVYGYYRPAFTEHAATYDINGYNISAATLEATGSVGGLFGELENAATNSSVEDTITITTTGATDTVSPKNSSTGQTNYGGLIGKYKANETADSLIVTGIKSNMTNNASVKYYGGAIGSVNTGSYVSFDDFTLTGATNITPENAEKFGGLVASADGAYIYAKGVTIGSAAISDFNGGGLIGSLGNGVLGMTGTVDVSNAQPAGDANNGQLVGTRDNALVYAENIAASESEPASTWAYSPSSAEVDNVGSWGDVVYFDGTTLAKGDVITSETNHVITFGAANPTDIDSVADYAIVSLLFQINPTNNCFINGTQLAENVSLTFTSDITLTGTGLRGITRDNGGRYTYSGTMNGGSKTVTLDIKNIGGTDRLVYYHTHNGLLGCAKNVTASNLYLSGSVQVKPKADNRYIGAFAGEAQGTLTASGCKTKSELNINIADGGKSYVAGRFVGRATVMKTMTVSDSEFDGTISGGGDRTVGGVLGNLEVADNVTPDWTFPNVGLKGTVTGVKTVGGLVASVSGGNRATIKLVGTGESATGVVADGIVVSGSGGSMGGLLGYNWLKADVEVTKVSVSNAPTVNYTGTGGTAGLVYRATGHWTVTDLNLSGVKMSAPSATNIGMIVNRGTNGSGNDKSGIYLELPSGYAYTLSFASGSDISNAAVFDELCAYSADSAGNIMTNKQGIVSISTPNGLKMEGTAEDSLSYRNQTTEGAADNPNTRYYYNLDLIDDDADLSASPASQLMSWGVYQYACTNIRNHFKSSITFNSANTYDMKGYSWYPVTLENEIGISGIFKFYNKEFTDCESKKSTDNKWLPNTTSATTNQHYMMQNGLFYNVTSNLTLGNVTLRGNIGATGTTGTGALVYGTVSGSSSAQSDITVIDSTSGSISLDGIKVWNFQGTEKVSADYAPLLINQTRSYVTLNISNVSTTSTYSSGEEAGTSLIGKAGIQNGASIDVGINVAFSNIKLDGRSVTSTPALSEHRYNTTKSIFTRATLLEQLVCESGIYNFTYASDWGTGTPHNVTYGKEIWDGSGNNAASGHDQYIGEEYFYSVTTTDTTKYYTSYASDSASAVCNFSDFLPYVANVSTKEAINAGTGTYYQLQVNHQPSETINGCGTYNDPYIIASADDLVTISKWIAGEANMKNGDKINAIIANAKPYFDDHWCDNAEHVQYTYNGTNWVDSNSNEKSSDLIRQYLAGAYYKIELTGATELTLSSDSGFVGLGIKDSSYRFRGYIIGGGTTIVNQTDYPLINYSDGSVIKGINLTVDKEAIILDDATDSYDYVAAEKTHGAYGAVIGVVAAGDNIIDGVQVTFGDSIIQVKGVKAQLTPVGGYIGVIVNGGIVFRNMSGNISGLANKNVTAVRGAAIDAWPNVSYVNDAGKLVGVNSNTTLASVTSKMTDSSETLWLYVNPIIGRVINGYAFTETTSYHADAASCTMKNGNKHYSITDVKSSWLKENEENILGSSEKLAVSEGAKTISVPNSQSFYLMSVIVNSGAAPFSNLSSVDPNGIQLGYHDSYYTVHQALYTDVGTTEADHTNCDDYKSYASKDMFWTTHTDAQKLNYVPYVIKQYATSDDARTIGCAEGWKISLTSNGSYTLPDGYRGIGNFYQSNEYYYLNVAEFDGKGSTITQNTVFYTYDDSSSDYDKTYYPTTGFSGDNSWEGMPDAGLGLFNKQFANTTSFHDFTLSGLVKFERLLHNTGKHVNYTLGNMNKNYVLSTGALFGDYRGTTKCEITDVILENITISSTKNAGGMIGYVSYTGGGLILNITTSANGSDSSGITVSSGLNAGGLIGRVYTGTVTVDFNNHAFGLTQVTSGITEDKGTVSGNANYGLGVGGLIGVLRGGTGDPAPAATIRNVTIGDKGATTSLQIGCTDSTGSVCVGGLIGTLNRASPTMINCHVYNVSVSANGTARVGGAFGHVRTSSKVTVQNSSIESNITGDNKPVISGNTYVGGFLGNSESDTHAFIIQDSYIKGYEIVSNGKDKTGSYSGGIVGERNSSANGNVSADIRNLRIENVSVINCKVTADKNNVANASYAGGIAGNLVSGRYIYGFNIVEDNVTIVSTGKNYGYIAGSNSGIIKIAGFSYLNSNAEILKMSSAIGNNGNYGNNGYVIFADYNGDCLASATRSLTFSNVNATTNVTASDGKSVVSDNDPYVTSATPVNIGGSYFLTSDGVSSTAYTNIAADITSSANGCYSLAADHILTQTDYITDFASADARIKEHLSTYQEEIGEGAIEGIDFPMLVVDDITKLNTTALINDYIRLLTNTEYTYNYNAGSTHANTVIFDTKLCKCTFSEDGSTLTIDDATSCLKMDGSYFYMTASDTDTASETPQFSLIDVQFKDPSAPAKVAYHLYIPVYVRKLLEYNFDISLESGTDYVPAAAITANTLLENIGVPVTAEFKYTYKRTQMEWQSAVEAGDSLLANYPKKLRFTNSSLIKDGIRAGLEAGNTYYNSKAKMVLIDTQNGSKAYYCNSLTDSVFTEITTDNWTLDLQQFTDSSDNAFSPIVFNDLVTVTATQSDTGKFVCVEDAGGTATVRDNSGGAYNGKTYRLKEESDTTATLYNITISDAANVSEHYFLSIFMEADYDDANLPVYHYAITSPGTLGISPYPSRVGNNHTAHYLTGKIYENSLTLEPKSNETDMYHSEHKSGEDYKLEATLTATVSISSDAQSIIGTYLNSVEAIEIYQSFLTTLNMRDGMTSDKGIKALKNASATNYSVGGSAPTNVAVSVDSNYVEFKNNTNLRQKLSTGAVTIKADIMLEFDEEDIIGGNSDDSPAQFYPGPVDGVGTTLIGYSNIASNKNKTEYSKISKEVEDNTRLYYYNRTESVAFEYSAYADNEIGLYGQLGINANDLDENPVPLTTLGVYDVSKFQTSAIDADYLQIEVELLTIDNSYNAAETCNIGDYLTGLTFVTAASPVKSDTSNAKKWVYMYPKSAFALESQTYQIPINYSIYTGNTPEFERSSRKYSNYEVKITVSMWKDDEESEGHYDQISNSEATDFIKYTNARIYKERVNPNKAEP